MADGQKMEVLFHSGECPYNYQCKAMDCTECMKIHMEDEDGES